MENYKVMGIINLNDDSFVSSSRVSCEEEFCRRADALLEAGADIIDIGAVSSRPGSEPVSPQEEWRRLEPFVVLIARKYLGYSFSIDTFRASVVMMAYQEMGRFIVNDISAGEWDGAMLPFVGRLGLRYVAMHHKGTFETMHNEYYYDDITEEVISYFKEFSQRAEAAGVKEWILDPGFGFSKNVEQNLELLSNLARLKQFRKPILAGLSNKRCTGGDTEKYESIAVRNGATIIRTHLI